MWKRSEVNSMKKCLSVTDLLKYPLSFRLKRLRCQHCYTQTELAGFLGITQSTVSAWENGTCYPSVMTCEKLSEFYNLPVEFFWDMEKFKINKK